MVEDGLLVRNPIVRREPPELKMPDRSAVQPAVELVSRVDCGELTVDVARRVPLSELPAIHAQAAAGALRGKIVAVPTAG